MLYCYCVLWLLFTYNEQLLFNIFMHRSIIYHDDKEKKESLQPLLALGLGAVTMFSQFPVSAAEETAQNTDAAAQTADPSVVVTNGIDGWPPGFRYFVCRSNCNGNFH